jgi:Immunity protein 53
MGLAVSELEKWYGAQSDGHWEHPWGVAIDTLDNPGWKVKIALRGTVGAGRMLERVRVDRSSADWLQYWVKDDKFEAACGPLNLTLRPSFVGFTPSRQEA